jgi:myosin heavy subunit
MSSELELMKQRITELEAENVEIAELRKENAELRKENTDLRTKFANFEAERAELKRRIAETLRMTEEERTRRDAENVKLRATIEELKSENIEVRDRLTKVEQNQLQNDNSSNNNSSNFNSVAVPEAITVPTNSAKRLNGKLLEEKDMDSFLLEAHKKIVSSEIKQRNKEKKLQAQESLPTHPEEKVPQELNSCNRSHKKKGMDELKHELFNPPSETDSPSSINHNIMTEVSETARPEKFTCDGIDESSHHLAQLCDKAIDAEDRANRANQEEILCWCLYWKDFRNQLDEIIRSNSDKFGEKKARNMLYDTITEQLSILCKKNCKN